MNSKWKIVPVKIDTVLKNINLTKNLKCNLTHYDLRKSAVKVSLRSFEILRLFCIAIGLHDYNKPTCFKMAIAVYSFNSLLRGTGIGATIGFR